MNRKAFFDAVRAQLGALTQGHVAGFTRYLDEGERRSTQLDWLAYILATVWWETGRTMQPVKEAFWKSEAWRKANLRYFPWYGRGDIQLTWEVNYRKAGQAIGVDLIKDPDAALDPANAVRIAFDGMEQGWFTGKELGDYLDGKDEAGSEDLREYANARRIINGTDKQIEIGKLALMFEGALRVAGYAGQAATSEPVVSVAPVPAPALPAAPASTPSPAPIGHNGGPALEPEPRPANPSPTPVEQASKAVGAGKWTAIVGAAWAAVSAFLMATPAVPATYRDPVLLAGIGTLLTTLASIVGAYQAPANAVPPGSTGFVSTADKKPLSA